MDRRGGGGGGNEKGPGGKGSEIVLNLLIVNNHARDTHLSESCTNNIIILPVMIYPLEGIFKPGIYYGCDN